MGAAGATTGGVKRLPPVGLMLFSVGAAGALLGSGGAVVVVVVVVVVDGSWVLLLSHPAVSTPNTPSTATPTEAIRRRRTLPTVIGCSYLSVRGLGFASVAVQFVSTIRQNGDAHRAVRSVLGVLAPAV